MGDQTKTIVEIGIRNQSDEQIIFVKDNSVGVENKYHEKIFGLIEKLVQNLRDEHRVGTGQTDCRFAWWENIG